MQSNKARFLTTPSLILITLVAIINLRNIPMMAEQGYSILIDYGIAAIAFLIPSALICAQSASQYPQAGGVYHWVQEAFGDRWGFFTIWSEWFNNLIGFPATLLFICDTFLNAVMPTNAHFTLYLTIIMLALLWVVTWLNCRGIALSTRLSSIGAVIGTIIPAVIIAGIVLAFHHHYHATHHFATTLKHPSLLSTLSILVACIASYSGMQVTAFHTPNIIKPRKTLPRALIISIILILVLTILPTIAIIMLVPNQQLNVITGIWQFLTLYFHHNYWIACAILICICIGTLASLSTWMLAPARGLFQSAKDNFLPKYFSQSNSNGSPKRILIMQAIVVSLFILWLYSSKHLSQGFWILAVLTSQFTLVMYCFIFAAGIKNRFTIEIKNHDGFQIPKWLTIIVSLLGIGSCVLGYVLSYHKPSFLPHLSVSSYHHDLIVATVVYIVIPLYFILQQKKLKSSRL